VQQNGFGPTFLYILLRLVKDTKSLTPAVDWLDSSIGPGGSLLVPFHPFSVLVLWVFLEKIVNNQNLDAINIFSGSQTEHSWRCP
jgi:hypothetical protein